MPVSGKEELGMRSSISFAGIPIKKRRFPFVFPSSPPPEDPTSFCDGNDLKKTESASIPSSSFNPIDTTNNASRSDLNKNPLLEARQERLEDGHISSSTLNIECSDSKLAEADDSSIKLLKEPSVSKSIEHDYVSVHSSQELSGSKPAETNASSVQYKEEASGSMPAHTSFSSVQYMGKPSGSQPAETDLSFSQSIKDSSGSKSVKTCKETGGFQPSRENVASAQSNEESLGSKPHILNEKVPSGSGAGPLDHGLLKVALTESNIGVLENTSTNVKMEIMDNKEDSCTKFQLSALLGNAELSFRGASRQSLSVGVQNREASEMCDSLDPSLLSLSLHKEKAMPQIGSSNSRSSDVSHDTDRSNWDLNTTMDTWVGSDKAFQDTDKIDTLCHFSTRHELRHSLTSNSIIGAYNDKGKQVCGVFEPTSHFSATSIQSSLSSKSLDSLCLSLGSTFRGFDLSKPQVCSMSKADSILHSNTPRTTTNLNSVGCGSVKEEPIDDSSKQDFIASSNSTCKTLDSDSSKRKFIESGNMESLEFDIHKVIEKKSMKPEPLQEPNQETCRTMSNMELHQTVGNVVPSNESSTLPVPLKSERPLPTKLPTFSELSVSRELPNQSEYSIHRKDVDGCENTLDQRNAGSAAKNEHSALEDLTASGSKTDACESDGVNVDSSKTSNLEQSNRHPHATVANGEQDMDISAVMEEESFCSDIESDGHHLDFNVEVEGRPSGKEDDELEDGEVREPTLHSIPENPIVEGSDSEKVIDSDSHTMVASGDDNIVRYGDEEKDETMIHPKTATSYCTRECDGTTVSEKLVDQSLEMDGSSISTKSEVVPATCYFDAIMPVSEIHQMHFEKTETEHKQEENIEGVLCDETGVTVSKISVEDTNGTAKDSSAVKSRIINLPRASSSISPSKSRSVMGIPLSSRSGRERYFVVQDGKFRLSGNRGEMYHDGSNKYTRDRFRDRSYERPTRGNYIRGRGRGSGRYGRSHREWDSERNFSYNNNRMDDYCFTRHKRGSSIDNDEVERNDFDVLPDRAVLGPPSRGRKLLNGGSPSFRQSSSRRHSPGDRGIQRHGRIPRNTSPPSRCTDEGGSEMVELGHGERFDMIDPPYNRRDGQFSHGKTMFPAAIQRRGGYSRVRSKSPDESGQRHSSSGHWSSSRRRAMEGLDESPIMYRRVDRMRSPECDYFSEEMIPRRRDSPSYCSRDGDDTIQERRSPSNRLFPRKAPRPDGMNRGDRVDDDGDDYFGGSTSSNRKYSERRARSFRGPPYNNNNNNNNDNHIENFRFHSGEDGPRTFRCSPDEDQEFMERNNTRRGREFEARLENRTGISPGRRMRNVEDQDGNYRPNAPQVWRGDGMKRRSMIKRQPSAKCWASKGERQSCSFTNKCCSKVVTDKNRQVLLLENILYPKHFGHCITKGSIVYILCLCR
ncbi:hypothetical protein DM860_013524 [Cuscuta australis]|uniref:Uncharacterized protein n=1 Tax=Cuscuta australis TaxID=267555 RepID=A0A328EDS6_9ASTE|nr:hypothetical protein DM860_013524 [Cuscuta australis]